MKFNTPRIDVETGKPLPPMKTLDELREELMKSPEFVKRYEALSSTEIDHNGNYWFMCQCYTEAVQVSICPDPDGDSIGLSMWVNRMYNGRWGTFWQRLRWAVGVFRDILRDGRPNFTDILLDPADARRLGWVLVALSGAEMMSDETEANHDTRR